MTDYDAWKTTPDEEEEYCEVCGEYPDDCECNPESDDEPDPDDGEICGQFFDGT